MGWGRSVSRARNTAAMAEPKQERMTEAQRDKLAAELAELEGPKRTAVVQAIKTAREFGDLSENAEYHAAKNEQGLLEARIRTLRRRLDHSVLVEAESEGSIGVGSVVNCGCKSKVGGSSFDALPS